MVRCRVLSCARFRKTFLPEHSAPVRAFLGVALLLIGSLLTACGSGSPPALAISTSSLPTGVVGIAYSASLGASGGTAGYTWSVASGTLPDGLYLNPSTGAISGTPAAVGSTHLTFSVTDSSKPAQTQSVSLVLAVAPVLSITTFSLPGGITGTAYSASLQASGGTGGYTWSASSGTLPAGLSLTASTGAISGSPTAAGNTALTFTVADSGSPAQTQSVSLTLSVIRALAVTTVALPAGVQGVGYSASLTAVGGTGGYTWTLTSGTIPAGLSLNATTGAITGIPSATGSTALTVTVTDSGSPAQSKSVSLALTVVELTISLSPDNIATVINREIVTSAITNDPAGVNWSVSGANCTGTGCGTLSEATTMPGAGNTYTSPSTGGIYTVTVSNASTGKATASFNVAVTDLAGVTTYHNDLYRDGANTQEYALTPANVKADSFGKLFSCVVDGAIYTQPLWAPNLTIGSVKRNVVFVATQHDSVFAFDADSNTSPCTPLWQANLLDAAHGAGNGETPVPSSVPGTLVGKGNGDVAPEVGVTGTPVIDLSTNILYVVAKSVDQSGTVFHHRLHALDLLTGSEKFAQPATIEGEYPGSGDGGLTTTFVPRQEHQRPGLALANGLVYISWSSHEDALPYYGWVMAYKASDLSQVSALNVTPDVQAGGIWMSGGAPAVDQAGNVYLITANGEFDASQMSPPSNDYGDSFLQLSPTLDVEAYFTPSDQAFDAANDADFGSGGATLFDLPANGANPTHLAIGGGKDAFLCLVNRDAMGGLYNVNSVEHFNLGHSIYATGAYWNSTYYIAGSGGPLSAFPINAATAKFNQTADTVSSHLFHFPGSNGFNFFPAGQLQRHCVGAG